MAINDGERGVSYGAPSEITDGGGPAFPPTDAMSKLAYPGREYDSRKWWPGMSKLEAYALAAMQALAHDILIEQHWEDVLKKEGVAPAELADFLADLSVTVAEAMIRAVERRTKAPAPNVAEIKVQELSAALSAMVIACRMAERNLADVAPGEIQLGNARRELVAALKRSEEVSANIEARTTAPESEAVQP